MKKNKVTSSDIAKAAGVSQSTVSMVLNRKYNVSFSKETIRKVEQAAKEMGYEIPKRKKPKESKRDKLIVVFCSNLTNPYYVMLLQGIESRAKEQGYGLFVCNTQRDLRMEERYLKMMPELRPLGIIYTCNPSHCFMDMVEELAGEIPIAIINNQNEHLNVDAVELDNSKLGRLMARHLLELGHRKVAYIAPPLTTRQKQRSKRVEGFLKEFDAKGLKGNVIIKAASEETDEDVPNIDSEYKIGYDLTKEVLKEEKDVTAIVGLNDMIAFGILDALHEEKYKVPGDISVMGCDNTLFARMHKVSLTTIEHFVVFKGRDACDIIMKKIMSQNSTYSDIQPISTYHVEYEPKLIARGTTSYAKTKISSFSKNITNNSKRKNNK
ncbi:LacI family transcriptional regulator [Bariatricus massiliensis]|uniref:LacI family transcriptional regulator n=1 Tax=Bariatricus massiliensis TaxID=1745713 RepID=A0ABS8DLR7_9FIRM|nr:LacI family DNA-binding transcriptional regulator [Bariatricus massiliensis]MCB7306205.1 LacI family transcriptional regulator [Bariatricus massiliensis]MCB7376695.1 LacI family transcriptional regulator [Bariatricus massiliensis]MCB7389368.1 LacI family transcriptional regulator [Bariatricus massiliensis]MCB7413538.1 LacI family transcriptional regulator [Bariatricus massiliensis]MCQ5255411.1 LacI family transcriptional regulator [Bariatricus massiliensis]